METLMESSNTELETRYALLSDELDQALRTIAEHEHRITKLEKHIMDLVDWLRDSKTGSAVADQRDETPPPHY